MRASRDTHPQYIMHHIPSGHELIFSNSLLTMVLTKLSLNSEPLMDSEDHVIQRWTFKELYSIITYVAVMIYMMYYTVYTTQNPQNARC